MSDKELMKKWIDEFESIRKAYPVFSSASSKDDLLMGFLMAKLYQAEID